MPRKANDQISTKQAILNASLDIFSEKGYTQATMREIADRVGIKVGSIYSHFESKEKIYEAIFAQFMAHYKNKRVSPQAVVALGREKAMRAMFLSNMEEHRKALRILYTEGYRNTEMQFNLHQGLKDNARTMYFGVLEGLREKGEIPENTNTKMFAELLCRNRLAMIVDLNLAPEGETWPREQEAEVAEFVFSLIKNE